MLDFFYQNIIAFSYHGYLDYQTLDAGELIKSIILILSLYKLRDNHYNNKTSHYCKL